MPLLDWFTGILTFEHTLWGQFIAIPLAVVLTGYAIALHLHRHPKGETR
jgi:hypothetical protein